MVYLFIGLSVDRCVKSSSEETARLSHVRYRTPTWSAERERPLVWREATSAGQISHFTRCSERHPEIQKGKRDKKRELKL